MIKRGVSSSASQYVVKVCESLGLPKVQLRVQAQNTQPLSFKPSERYKKPGNGREISGIEFQLLYGGPFMERSIDSSPDVRIPEFEPDRWQREGLDQIDAKESVFIVAPTSAGKTFISFYAMKQVLKEDSDGVIVYIVPTKAFVNQIAAEVQTKFRKVYSLKSSMKSIWTIHTRDHASTIPLAVNSHYRATHSPNRTPFTIKANSWTPRLRRIIFDEIHCIRKAKEGVIWEQLLLLSSCLIVALSATVGNPKAFHSWLKDTQKTNGHDLKLIQHKHRYSDLRKYLYSTKGPFHFKGFPKPVALPPFGLDDASDMRFLHLVTSLVDRSRGIPEDLSLESRYCLSLWQVMHDLRTDNFQSMHLSILVSSFLVL
ncbi:hypothetical protein N7450_000802 [Penicillium hetheringtonii]|uniref:Helicase ATP-binding domain-containing protein n=1 Tax=Penicillium hetheringtonii TaxID=911720 RepID=A0AAD6E2Y5_9EURO|nr:hypothetical protein N7450_000802 [Penicillium hetheringtonii]